MLHNLNYENRLVHKFKVLIARGEHQFRTGLTRPRIELIKKSKPMLESNVVGPVRSQLVRSNKAK